MKTIILAAHDPGGYDVIQPVYQAMMAYRPCTCLMVGPAANLAKSAALSENDALETLKSAVQMHMVAALITGTSWGSQFEIDCILVCKKAGIPTISILDYWSNYAARFKSTEGNFIYPDYYCGMDDLARQESVKDGVPEQILRVVGHPGLDKFCRGLNNNRYERAGQVVQRVLFLSQPLLVLYGESLGYTERTALADIVRLCKECNLQLAVKFHPKDDMW